MKLLSILFTGITLAQNLIINGGFEDNATLNCPYSWCGPPGRPMNDSAIAPWYNSRVGGTYDMMSRVFWPGWGNWVIELNGISPTTFSQNVTLVPKQLYVLKFKLNRNPGQPAVSTGFVTATGATQLSFRYVPLYNTSYFNSWKNIRYLFRATVADTVVSIGSTSPGGAGIAIDEVYLTVFAESCPLN